MDSANEAPKLVSYEDSLENCDNGSHGLWPRKQRMSKRDVAFGLNTSVGLGAYLGIMGSRRDVVTAMWKTGLEGVWPKDPIFMYLNLQSPKVTKDTQGAPVAWDSKHAIEDDWLSDGTRVKAGDRVTHFLYGMGRMEAVWGKGLVRV